MVPALMAACGASDSVITHTSVSKELRVPLLLFSISLHGWGVLLNRLMLLFSAQYHTLCITSVTGGLPRSRHWPTQRNEKEMEEEKLLGISLSISPESDDVHVTSEQERGDLSYPSVMHSYISHIYINIYIYTPCCFVLKEERQFCKTCTCGGLIAIVLFSFLYPLWCLPNTVDLNEEKSLMSFKSNQVNEVSIGMIESMKDLSVCFSGLNYF